MFTVLFLGTGNSARSILAEAAINHLAIGGGKFRGFSAGSHPAGRIHPFALELLKERGFPTEGLRSKSWDEFAAPGAPPIDVVITVCDQAAAEACPVWPGRPTALHWSIPDPAAVTGSETEQRQAFAAALRLLRQHLERFVAERLEPAQRGR